jgi:Trypsin
LPDDGTDDPSITGVQTTTATTAETATFPRYYYPSTPRVKYSQSALTAVKGSVLLSDVTGVENMYGAYLEAEHNRVVVEASVVTEEMRTALASRYGADMVALYLTPDQGAGEPLSRNMDTTPFYGGAYAITTTGNDTRWHCTIGFPWTYNSEYYYLTAGHCTGLNTHVWMPKYGTSLVGLVVKDSWNNNTGSVKIDGQSYNTGDLALVKLYDPYHVTARMYVGGYYSTSSRTIGPIASRAPKIGDSYCSGGSTQGEICGWKVRAISVDRRYVDGTVVRNIVEAKKTGRCAAEGDSGGPVYTIRSNGEVAPRGIISGGYSGSTCTMQFSDIRIAEKALPGGVMHL